MRVIMCQDKFVSLIKDGRKRQTIRASARCKPGDALSLRRWSGRPYRSKQEVVLETTCTSVEAVRIDHTEHPTEELARADGFDGVGEMLQWFEYHHGLPFDGWIIRWE